MSSLLNWNLIPTPIYMTFSLNFTFQALVSFSKPIWTQNISQALCCLLETKWIWYNLHPQRLYALSGETELANKTNMCQGVISQPFRTTSLLGILMSKRKQRSEAWVLDQAPEEKAGSVKKLGEEHEGGMVHVAHSQPNKQFSPSSCLRAETPWWQRRKQPHLTFQGMTHDHPKSMGNPFLFAKDWSWDGHHSGQWFIRGSPWEVFTYTIKRQTVSEKKAL